MNWPSTFTFEVPLFFTFSFDSTRWFELFSLKYNVFVSHHILWTIFTECPFLVCSTSMINNINFFDPPNPFRLNGINSAIIGSARCKKFSQQISNTYLRAGQTHTWGYLLLRIILASCPQCTYLNNKKKWNEILLFVSFQKLTKNDLVFSGFQKL